MVKKPRSASTVILARQHGGELQVYLLKRSPRSGFFPGTYVFPGGEVDPEDRIVNLWIQHLDMELEEISRRFGGGITEQEAIARGVTAIRETFEEAGVLLCSLNTPRRGSLEGICTRLMDRGLPRGWLRELVVTEGWTLEFSRLARWAHWITPELMPRRYETRFFLACMPSDQECVPDTHETTYGVWISPEQGLVGNLRGEIPLSPPTLITLQELLHYPDVEDLKREIKSRSWGDAMLPRMISSPQGSVIIEPWDPLYDQETEINSKALENATLPVGEPFSRLWFHEGIWKPVQI